MGRLLTRAWLGPTCAALFAIAPAAVRSQIVQRAQGSVTVPGTPDPAAEPAPSTDTPDERPLWRLLAAGAYPVLEQRVARLRTLYPAWQPPAQMRALMAQDADERLFATAKAAHDWPVIRRLAAVRPAIAGCARPDDAAVAAASPGGPDTLGDAMATCPDDTARLALLSAAFDRFGAGPVAPLLSRLNEAAMPAAGQSRLGELRAELGLRRLGLALSAGSAAARPLGEALRPVIEARRDAGAASALGWAALKAGQARDAVTWFDAARRYDPAQPVAGLVRAHVAAGEQAVALHLLAQAPAEPGSAGMVAEITAGRIAAAYAGGAYAEAASLAARQPDPPPTLGWSLFRLRRFDAAALAFERRYRRHHEDAAADGMLLSLIQAGRPEDAVSIGTRLGGRARAAILIAGPGAGPDLGYQLALARLRLATDRGDHAALAGLSQDLAGPVQARGDAAAATALGWAAVQQGQWSRAAPWFAMGRTAADPATRDSAAYGTALADFNSGDDAAAIRAAADHPNQVPWQRLRLDAMMHQAGRAADATPGGPDADAAARAVLQLDPDRRDARLLLAWSAYHQNRRIEASAAFEQLYRTVPDQAAASGLATATDDPAAARALAAAMGGPLQAAIDRRDARDAFARKDFLTAVRIDPTSTASHPGLANLQAPTFGLAGTYRSKSGGTGTSRLEAATTDAVGTYTMDTDRVTLRLHLIHLEAGRPPGTPGLTTRLPLGVEPVVGWERQPSGTALLSPFAELGTTPLGGKVAPTVQGRAGMGWQSPAPDALASLRVTAYRQSVTESLLSFTGATDPAGGRRFGRVMETGGRVEGYGQVLPRWGLYGQAGAGLRDGVGVRANGHVQAAATLSYDLRVPFLDSLTIGPSYQFSAFGHDLGGFTPGQGGYYSPAASHTAGAALRLLTRESEDFMVRLSAFSGWQAARSAGTATRPASRQDGLNTSGEMTAAYRLSESWIVGGLVRYQVSPQYNDAYTGLALTYSFAPRAALLSADLPRFDLR